MTQILQVGDIVRIEEPTQEELNRLEKISYVGRIRKLIGSYAVITGVSRVNGSVVTLLPCDEEFTLTVDTIPEMTYGDATTVLATHLTLIREGALRTHRFTKDTPDDLGGARLPLVGSTVNNHERVDGVHLFPWGVRIDVTSTDGTSSSIGITVPLIEPALPFTTF
jgi:hypothetical protein